MKSTLKDVVREITPPFLLHTLRRLLVKSAVKEWAYVPEGWAYAKSHGEVRGWNVPDILDVYKREWPKFEATVQGTGALGLAHESRVIRSIDINNHNTAMSFAYTIALAALRLESLSMLDWGGGIGHYYLLTKALLPGLKIDYHCKDVPLMVGYGNRLFPEQHFYSDDKCFELKYDYVLASGSLHYTQDWQRLIAKLARATRGYLYVTRLPTVLQAPSYVFVQRPYAHGYNTEYLGWCLNRTSFLSEAKKSALTLVREFMIAERPPIENAPEQCQYRGFLFRSFN